MDSPAPSVAVPAPAPRVPVAVVAAAVKEGGGAGSVVLSGEALGTLLRSLESGCTRVEARKAAGVSSAAFLAQYRGNAVFREAVDDAEAGLWDEAEGKLLEAVRDGEPWAIREALKHRGMRDRWAVASEGGGAVGSGGVVSAVDVLALGAELERRAAALRGPLDSVLEGTGRESKETGP